MNEDKKKNIIIVLLLGIIVILVVLIVLAKAGKIGLNNRETNNNKDGNNALEGDSNNEKFGLFLDDISSPLGFLVVISTFNENKVDKNFNYLSAKENRQVFVMEYILKDSANYQNFVTLSALTGEVLTDNYPTDEMTLAYYPYDLFNEVYKKFFNEDFDIVSKLQSTTENEYDKSNDYVFYYNRRAGSNGLSITNMEVKSITLDKETNMYTANISITYSDRLASNINTKTDTGEIMYSVKGNRIILDSFIVK